MLEESERTRLLEEQVVEVYPTGLVVTSITNTQTNDIFYHSPPPPKKRRFV